MSDPTSTSLPGAAADPVTGVADAVASLGAAATQYEANLAAEAGRKNTAAMIANQEAQNAERDHAEFVTMQKAAAAGDANALVWLQRAISGAGLICLLFILGACAGLSTATVAPTHGPIPSVADYSDVPGYPGGLGKVNPDGSAIVTDGLKANYARLVKKYHPDVDVARGFTVVGNASNGVALWHMDADVFTLYGDMTDPQRNGISN